MAYLVLAYPELTIDSYNHIQNFRKQHDTLYFNVVEPHFTFVFPVFDINEEDFISAIKEKAVNFEKFEFAIRCATISKNVFTDLYHILLVPDEGYSNIVKIHDKLYSGILKDNLQMDIDFIPHIGIGNSQNKFHCKKLVDEWNAGEFSINGTISRLAVVKYENNIVSNRVEIILKTS